MGKTDIYDICSLILLGMKLRKYAMQSTAEQLYQ